MKAKRIRPESNSSLKKAVQNVQDILKKDDKKPKKSQEKSEKQPTATGKLPEGELKYTTTTGVVYLSHIPHGFYEEQMKEYFTQFGKVNRVRHVRSKRSGRSRGYGYIEFEFPEVAKVAAETMNNYLMCGRLLKAAYIPPEKQHFGYFFGKDWSPSYYPNLENRKKEIRLNHATISKNKHKKTVKKSLKKLSALEQKLKAKGINLKFEPVDLPAKLLRSQWLLLRDFCSFPLHPPVLEPDFYLQKKT
ncbi:MKI67 FHA domain-interacting nucleolar phosphoprotein [Belonocnema kinseyi]|uniref:MKI67 FHA domain-interacting nucleolar phosphoprotein n=1 Tax=Belonocnema kinseyi TaxID=2817044 RepID=UPI00143E07D7|nr:MKI67 FHA domain-interacting nucleolar phosphoprotein [Belonocnema kinseyi]